MSLEKKSVHVRLSPEMHQRLGVMADFHEKADADLAAVLLEEAIAGKFHSFTVAAERMGSLGLIGKDREI